MFEKLKHNSTVIDLLLQGYIGVFMVLIPLSF